MASRRGYRWLPAALAIAAITVNTLDVVIQRGAWRWPAALLLVASLALTARMALRGRVTPGMSRADVGRWADARTLADLGTLTAQWLEGTLGSQPDYAPGSGPDEETAGLVPVLAACNRAGFVTRSSQPGLSEMAGNGARAEQRAMVAGFASVQMGARLEDAAHEAGLIVISGPARRWRTSRADHEPLTRRNSRSLPPFSRSGALLSRRYLRWLYSGGCH